MREELLRETCFFCGQSYACGPHHYDGAYVRHLDISVCDTCQSSNWDGLAPRNEAKLLTHLKAQGLPVPARNWKGLLPLR